MSEPTAPEHAGRRSERPPWRLWDHIGVISGVVLGFMAFGFLVLLAVAGDAQALGLVVIIVTGVALIVFGGKLHGLTGR